MARSTRELQPGQSFRLTRYEVYSSSAGQPPALTVTKTHTEQTIAVLKQGTRSIDSQIRVSHWLVSNEYGPRSDGIKRSSIEDEIGSSLTHATGTSLSHLVDIGLVEEFLERDITYTIAEWHPDTFVMGMVEEAATDGIEALIDELEPLEARSSRTKVVTDGSGTSLREVVASAFDLQPEKVESYLRGGDPLARLNEATEAIEESEEHEVGDDYGKIVFRNPAYHYRLTETAIRLYKL